MITDEDREIVLAFLQESTENLDQLDRDLVELESTPDDPELLARIFRTIHTIKGTCGFLGFDELERLTHAGENLLGAMRSGDLALTGPIATSLLRLVDAVRTILDRIERDGSEGDADPRALIAELAAHLDTSPDDVGQPHAPAPVPTVVTVPAPVHEAAAPPSAPGPASAAPAEPLPHAAETSVRVDVAVLDKLMDLVGELVLTRSQIGDLALRDEDGPLNAPYRSLRLLTSELQDGVMRARLQPVGIVIGKFPRIARDIAADLGKQVVVELEGEDVGVDKAINEALRDPLLHLVRNAVDHGLETPAERLSAGKDDAGTLRIKAYHERGRIHVDVSDDGRGVDPRRLVDKAVTSGLLTRDEGARMTKHEALDLVFRPGLSTKETVTNLSGRGVGMDVVRSNLQQIGGSIELSSMAGVGTVFRIDVPLTLAIMPTLVVGCGGERYAIPQVNVREIVHVDADSEHRTYEVDGVLVHQLRGQLLPVVDLAHQLGLRDRPTSRTDDLDLVVVECDERRYALVVDSVGDTVDAVVKPLTSATRRLPTYAGVTILTDGRAALILDVAGVANRAGLAVAPPVVADETAAAPATLDHGALLIAHGDADERVALRLDGVQRLERFAADGVDHVGGREMVRYGDGVLPLVRLRPPVPPGRHAAADPDALIDVVVCASSVGDVGVVVASIDDIVAAPPVAIGLGEPTAATEHCLVVDGVTTELVDVERLVHASDLGGRA